MLEYTNEFYKTYQEGSRRSAKEIIPLIFELIQPKSVIDVGCGIGTWLSVLKEFGVEDIIGVDGDYISKEMLQIPVECFLSFDLKKPFRIERQFDLVLSLEVAEHLPSKSASTFVDSLVRLGPVILFSAAIPFQGGTNHINEQWPDYWVKLFQNNGYIVIDCIRNKIWQNDFIETWYVQNIMIFCKQDYLESNSLLRKEFENTNKSKLSIVHPNVYLGTIEGADPRNMSLIKMLSVLPVVSKRAFKRIIKNILFNK
ncbi:MAG: class I SAM-dependent methyltransferase [Methanosarcinales archaeon]|nr:class I SAM-dependent methyltransferase [Methanosarcinales archaeon]